jgi:hypothetical protein
VGSDGHRKPGSELSAYHQAEARELNERVAALNRRWGTDNFPSSFMCECADPYCTERFLLSHEDATGPLVSDSTTPSPDSEERWSPCYRSTKRCEDRGQRKRKASLHPRASRTARPPKATPMTSTLAAGEETAEQRLGNGMAAQLRSTW